MRDDEDDYRPRPRRRPVRAVVVPEDDEAEVPLRRSPAARVVGGGLLLLAIVAALWTAFVLFDSSPPSPASMAQKLEPLIEQDLRQTWKTASVRDVFLRSAGGNRYKGEVRVSFGGSTLVADLDATWRDGRASFDYGSFRAAGR